MESLKGSSSLEFSQGLSDWWDYNPTDRYPPTIKDDLIAGMVSQIVQFEEVSSFSIILYFSYY